MKGSWNAFKIEICKSAREKKVKHLLDTLYLISFFYFLLFRCRFFFFHLFDKRLKKTMLNQVGRRRAEKRKMLQNVRGTK